MMGFVIKWSRNCTVEILGGKPSQGPKCVVPGCTNHLAHFRSEKGATGMCRSCAARENIKKANGESGHIALLVLQDTVKVVKRLSEQATRQPIKMPVLGKIIWKRDD